ncbi:sigma-54 interaction domain-containing protein [Sphingomicrobium astaxanthinifaciens]|uniref:sigma-54 interaction domain-containing protein n=1 Tax=Sphingomicrobium astaxanthinifaciens TaxID=1227949 RepID=UPI001FCAD6D9|nr:sigma 54-interacting transcriptional regulator [Sphingomicrobium astaxanthinifaciens]MCJ7420369.1 sigma 54-interacting transcriptional regulator [Sphingomicrobium astaxanthinifaciens]
MIEITEKAKNANPVLCARLAGVASALQLSKNATIAAPGEVIEGDTARIFIDHRAGEASEWSSERVRGTLTYDDPTGQATFGALVALLHQRRGPIAADPDSLAVVNLAVRLAGSDVPVLINGPTGTGKEVLARFIHESSDRADKPFVAVNCAAIPETMLEALLFGHVKGAYTGASAGGEGFFRAADGGTLLLDEIAEMPLALQAKLLRALQEGEVVPVGATAPVKIDVRVLACANRDLPTEVAEGRFRADLYYRLNVFPLSLAALRDRAEDIAPLAFEMIARHTPRSQSVPWIDEYAMSALLAHGWPGNIRELENVMRRALVLLGSEKVIKLQHIVFDQPARLVSANRDDSQLSAQLMSNESHQTDGAVAANLADVVKISEARAIIETLDSVGGKRREAAQKLGISERTLRYRLASFREAGLMQGAGR